MKNSAKRYISIGCLTILLSLLINMHQSVLPFSDNTKNSDSPDVLLKKQTNNMDTDMIESNTEKTISFNGTKEERALYLGLLKSEIQFMNANDQRYLTLDEWKRRKISTGAENARYTCFSIIDIDGDRRSEVLVQESIGSTDIGTWIFRIEDETIMRYHVSSRGMRSLKTDGTFRYSGGIYNYGIATVCFENYQMKVLPLIYCETVLNEFYEPVTVYYEAEKEINEKSFSDELMIQSEKKDVLWLDFNDINIAECFDKGEAP